MSINGNLYVPLGGWGRNINHDPRSKAYKAARYGTTTPKDVTWEIHIPPMDQGNLGSCVPHAGTAMLATDPFWGELGADIQKQLSSPAQAELYALQLYRDVTRADPYPGAWEPTDTGSDGLSLAKVLQSRGLNNGYEHVMSIDDAHAAIQKGPYPIGISFLANMETPGKDGVVSVSGRTLGGHEILVYRYDLTRDLWWCRNSWSADWGLKGDFAFDTPGYQKLISLQADGTPMTPVSSPAPEPVDPTPAPVNPLADFPVTEFDNFAKRKAGWWPRYEYLAAWSWEQFKEDHPELF